MVLYIEVVMKERFGAKSVNNLFKSCRRCLNPWVIGLIIVVAIGLLIFVPIIGVATLVVTLPLIGCVVMCGVMAFMMRGGKEKDKE